MATQTLEQHPHHASTGLDQQIRAYHGFMVGMRYVVVVLIVTTTFLTLAYASDAGLGSALFVAAVELAVGLYFARDRDQVGWPSVFGGLFISTAAESGMPIEERLRAEAEAWDAGERSEG